MNEHGGKEDLAASLDRDIDKADYPYLSASRRNVGVEDLADDRPLAFDLQQMEEVGEAEARDVVGADASRCCRAAFLLHQKRLRIFTGRGGDGHHGHAFASAGRHGCRDLGVVDECKCGGIPGTEG